MMALKAVGDEFETSSYDDKPCGMPVALSNEFSGGGYVFCGIGAFSAACAVRVLASSPSRNASWPIPCSNCREISSSLSLPGSPFVFCDFRRDPSMTSLLSRFRLLVFDGGWRLLGGIMKRVVIHWSRHVVCSPSKPMINEPKSRLCPWISGKLVYLFACSN